MKKVIIIGAGISGLATAWWLCKRFPSIHVTIVESSDRIGGLVCLKQQKKFLFDLGPKGFLTQGDGAFTLQLIKELGLDQHLIVSDPKAKNRFVHYHECTHKISLWTLIKNGLITTCLKDLLAPRYHQDSSVAEFLKRHSSKNFIRHILNPFILATKAAHSHLLSTHMAFPELAQQESKHGSLFIHYLKNSKLLYKKQSSYLASLTPSLYLLVETLQKKLPVTWKLSQQVTNIQTSTHSVQITTNHETLSADLLIYTGPIASLPSLFNHSGIVALSKTIYPLHLSNISLAWKAHQPTIPHGYGILFADEPPLLGMMFPSHIFPNQQRHQTTVSLLMEGIWHDENAYAYALSAISRYLQIFIPPDAYTVFAPPEGLPQHSVGFMKLWPHVKASLPNNIKIVGQNIAGPGMNRCIAAAFRTVQSLKAL